MCRGWRNTVCPLLRRHFFSSGHLWRPCTGLIDFFPGKKMFPDRHTRATVHRNIKFKSCGNIGAIFRGASSEGSASISKLLSLNFLGDSTALFFFLLQYLYLICLVKT